MDREKLRSGLFAARVPRYTSYPTAPHFHGGIDAAVYRRWLAEIPTQAPLSLYIHIPFCDSLCWFCGCHTAVVNHYGPVKDYCALLVREAELLCRALGTKRRVSHIHWGGGSPTMLAPDDIGRLDRKLRALFEIGSDVEVAVEVDPRGLGQACVDAFAQAGLTRASVGLQDCDPQVQNAINRMQTTEETGAAIAKLRQAGVKSINLDLLYGLPRQTLASWERTLLYALTLNPDRLAVFGYAHLPSFKKHQALIPQDLLPGRETRLRQAELANQILSAQGYVSIGLDHFAKPGDSMSKAAAEGTLRRNFQGYTSDGATALLGLGASAIGSLPQGYVQNHATVRSYRTALDAGCLPVSRGIALEPEDRMRRGIIERIMCDLKVNLSEEAGHYGKTTGDFQDSLRKLGPLIDAGLVSVQGGLVQISPAWRVATRLVASAFDDYLIPEAGKHSVSA